MTEADDIVADWEERAAIIEFDSEDARGRRYSRSEAEAIAWRMMMDRHGAAEVRAIRELHELARGG